MSHYNDFRAEDDRESRKIRLEVAKVSGEELLQRLNTLFHGLNCIVPTNVSLKVDDVRAAVTYWMYTG